MIDNLPALDDENMRRKNTEKIVQGVQDVGEHFRELKKQNRINFIIGGVTALVIMIIASALLYSAFSTGGNPIDNMVDRDLMAQRYTCIGDDGSIAKFRNPGQSLEFIELKGGYCNFQDIRQNSKEVQK